MWSKRFAVLVLMVGLGAAAVAAGAESVGVLLRKGIFQEETVGDLEAAMKIYQGIVANEKANRPHVAQAKFRLGMCHVKKGEEEKAVGTFQELIKDFPGQTKLLEQARGQLAALGHAPESEEPTGIQLQEVWTFSGLDGLDRFDISRDGRYCTFHDPEIGHVMLRDLTTGEDRCLTEGKPGHAGWGLISPDSQWVAYRWRNPKPPGGLRIMRIDGSGDRLLHANDEKQYYEVREWSPDGKHLVAMFYDRDGVGLTHGTAHIAIFSVEDGSTRILKTFTPEENGHPRPRFSPDGRYVVYGRLLSKKSGREDIYLIPLDGGPEILAVESPAHDDVLCWLPDGETLLFRSDRRGEGWDAWAIRIVDGKPVGVPRLVKEGISWNTRGPVRTPTGGWAFYYKQRPPLEPINHVYLAAIDPETGKLTGAPKRVSKPGDGRERAISPAFSRDGKHLAYFVAPAFEKTPEGRRYGPGNIVIRSLESGQEREVALLPKLSDKGSGPWLRWAPDGRAILVLGWTETLGHCVYRVDVDTGKLNPMVPEEAQTATDWQLLGERISTEGDYLGWGELSPDGKTLFFARVHFDPKAPSGRQLMGCRVVARDVDTSEEREIYRNPDGMTGAVIYAASPDGQHVVIGNNTSVVILSTAGGEPHELLRLGEGFDRRTLAWTPDSRSLLLVKVRRTGRGYMNVYEGSKRFELWRVAADGGEPELLDVLPLGLGHSIDRLRVRPDGRQIAFTATDVTSHGRGRVRMLQMFASDEFAKEMCTANLRRIGRAIEQYKNDHVDVPDGLAGLFPNYLQDTTVLLCPADQSGGRPLAGAEDPETRCGYSYMFNLGTQRASGLDVALPVDFPAREGMTWKDARKLQLEYFGPVVPIVQCRHHSQRMFLSYGGDIYEAEHYWEESPRAGAELLNHLKATMETEPDTWAQRYDTQRFLCLLRYAEGDEAALAKLLKTHLKEHPDDETAREFLAELPKLRFTYEGHDDAEEYGDGEMYLDSSDLELIHDNKRGDQVVGVHFRDIPVPQGARIKGAYLQFAAYPEDPGSEKTDLVLHAELAANAEPFAEVKHNITSRRKTAASVGWSPEPWTVGGERSEKQRTPDLSSLIQEVVNQPDWKKGNSLALMISGSGRRTAQSLDGGWSGTPMLYVEH